MVDKREGREEREFKEKASFITKTKLQSYLLDRQRRCYRQAGKTCGGHLPDTCPVTIHRHKVQHKKQQFPSGIHLYIVKHSSVNDSSKSLLRIQELIKVGLSQW